MSWEADFNIVSPEKGDLEAYRVSTLANQARNKTEAVCAAIAPLVPQAGDDRSSPKMTKHAP